MSTSSKCTVMYISTDTVYFLHFRRSIVSTVLQWYAYCQEQYCMEIGNRFAKFPKIHDVTSDYTLATVHVSKSTHLTRLTPWACWLAECHNILIPASP